MGGGLGGGSDGAAGVLVVVLDVVAFSAMISGIYSCLQYIEMSLSPSEGGIEKIAIAARRNRLAIRREEFPRKVHGLPSATLRKRRLDWLVSYLTMPGSATSTSRPLLIMYTLSCALILIKLFVASCSLIIMSHCEVRSLHFRVLLFLCSTSY